MPRNVETDSYQGPDRREAPGWHLKREVTITQIISIVGILITVLLGWANLDHRLATAERDIQRIEGSVAESLEDIKHKLDKINDYLLRQANGNR